MKRCGDVAARHAAVCEAGPAVDSAGLLLQVFVGRAEEFSAQRGAATAAGRRRQQSGDELSRQEHSNQTHQSITDPEAMLYKKSRGSESKLSYLGYLLMENRNGLIVDTRLTRATGTAERDAALEMAVRIRGGRRRVTLGGDKNYDARDFVDKLREAAVTRHVAQFKFLVGIILVRRRNGCQEELSTLAIKEPPTLARHSPRYLFAQANSWGRIGPFGP